MFAISTLVLVLSFPLLLMAAYTLLFFLRGRNSELLTGPLGLYFYAALVALLAGVVVASHPNLLARAFAPSAWLPLWIAAGIGVGLLAWGVQHLLPGQVPAGDTL